jgi:NAD(P)-dependent dehydrogenase (short-subunit alcohol dehydrogenase family)
MYIASKHAALGIVRQLAHEWAPVIRVNGVAPGATRTDIRMPASFGLDEHGQRIRTHTHPSNADAEVERVVPLALHADPADHAGAFVVLASRRDGRAVTGARRRRPAGAPARGLVRVLLTGDRGRIGVPARARLEAEGHEVPGFDASTGGDVLDLDAVRAATAGVDVVVHLAGLADDRAGPPQDVMAVNVVGTYHVLLAAEEAGVRRVVYASSGKALGLLERPPDYLPVDDAHRGLPTRPYGLSKWLAEQL